MFSGILAVTMRNLVHCAVALIAFFGGIAAIFFLLRADFLGAVQVIVYVGAVAVLVLFAIMLTRNVTGFEDTTPFSAGASWGWLISAIVLASLWFFGLADPGTVGVSSQNSPVPLTVSEIGTGFMTRYAIPFEVMSLLLTAALVGAVVMAVEEPKAK